MQTRRSFLRNSALLGCSAAASPWLTSVALADAPWDNRLVVIILRGGLDGLDAVQPYGDPNWAGLRNRLAAGPDKGSLDLDGFFALHPALTGLEPMWRAGELAFAHATSTPYRDKRSHFDGQDLLEAGTDVLGSGVRDGWLNRMLQSVPGVTTKTAYAIGRGDMHLLSGLAPVANWSPDADLELSPQAQLLMSLVMEDDPALMAAFMEADDLSDQMDTGMSMAGQVNDTRRCGGHIKIAEFAAKQLRSSARVAAFSLNGWDTHHQQHRSLVPALTRLADTLIALKSNLTGPVWKRTTVVAMTEFGRTARENGTGGTDHGTGGVMVLAGGSVRGGRVYGDWPGLARSDLYSGRDLMPTRDVRAYAAWVMRHMTGIDRSVLERSIFPGLDMGVDPKIVL